MSVITQKRLIDYENNNLYDLIHNHFDYDSPEHYIVTKLNNDKSNHDLNNHITPKNKTENTEPQENRKIKSASVILPDKNSTTINLDRNSIQPANRQSTLPTNTQSKIASSKLNNDSKPHPKLEMLSGDPLPKENAPIKEITNTERENIKMEKSSDKIIHKKVTPTQTMVQNDPSIYDQIKESASAATLVEKSQVHVKLSSQIDEFTLSKIDIQSLSDSSKNFISLDHELFHLLGIVIIGKNLDIILFFRDGTSLQIAPAKWLKGNDENIKNTLLSKNYLYSYTDDFDINQFAKEIHSISSYSSVNDKYTEYWIEFLPIQPSK